LANVRRSDHLPFGEELAGGVAGRTAPRGYAPTNERNRFTGHARDQDTGYDHTLWRKLDSVQGRWTSPDPYGGSMEIGNPQSFNRYAYVLNDPVNASDPLGLFQLAPRAERQSDYVVEVQAESGGWGSAFSALWSLWAGRRDLFAVALQPMGVIGGGGEIVGDNQQNGSETKPAGSPQSDPCPPTQARFFGFAHIFANVAQKLDTNWLFVAAHSSYESGWLNKHNANLNNMFGLTRAGGRNLQFKSLEEGANLYTKILAPHVTGAKTIEDFIKGVRSAGYNSVNKDYDKKMQAQYDTILKYAQRCL
jgi:RHS repeat-associated protein